ncbi:MAG: peptide-methionine (R)-S-oxide reductase MsrB [Anaerovoracaceae bacterium]|nr:peptide-methionine (R)-S-oxide reductase MsrB [Clostridiales bacterium]
MKELIPDFKNSRYKEIYLAGGCFWGVQKYFDSIMGVVYTKAGYANGKSRETDYYSIGNTGHAETVYVVYDEGVISLKKLISIYFNIIDPYSLNRQGNDVGTQYRTGIYYVDEKDKALIDETVKSYEEKFHKETALEVEPLKNFTAAEEYHQNYLDKTPGGYCHIDLRNIPNKKPEFSLEGYVKPSIKQLKSLLTEEQFNISQQGGTESPFRNAYFNNREEGLYVDIVSGEPLFLSKDKFDSGSGWPSFTKPVSFSAIKSREDSSLFMKRVEVRSRASDSHLGHVFNDGPKEGGGLRYCINSGALRFIKKEDLEVEGYKDYLKYFDLS